MSESGNCSDIVGIPGTVDFLTTLPVGWIVALSLAFTCTVITLVLYIDMGRYINKDVKLYERRVWLYWLCGIFPAFSISSVCAMTVPRASVFCDFVSAIYLSYCVYEFYRLMLSYYSSHAGHTVSDKLSNIQISLQSPPLTCCCPCLPKIYATRKSLQRIQLSVLQVAFIRPLVTFVAVILLMNGDYTGNDLSLDVTNINLYITTITACSTMLAMYGLILIFRVVKEPLKKYHIIAKFSTVQLTLIFSNVQPALLSILASFRAFTCKPPVITADTIADEWNHFLLIIEMLLMSIVTRRYWKVHPHEDTEEVIDAFSSQLEAEDVSTAAGPWSSGSSCQTSQVASSPSVPANGTVVTSNSCSTAESTSLTSSGNFKPGTKYVTGGSDPDAASKTNIPASV